MIATDRLLVQLPDGTVKQRNPFTGTQVWTMPGRGRRPLPKAVDEAVPLPPGGDESSACAFCPGHHLDNPPEKARLVADGGSWRQLTRLPAGDLDRTVAGFRRVPNLFEICSLDYWEQNHGVVPPTEALERCDDYLADPAGRAHVERVWRLRERIAGATNDPSEAALRHAALGWLASTHELVIPRRHHVPGASTSDQLASSGTLSVAEHRAYVSMALDAVTDLYASSDAVAYVSVFQNWLKPAGASFEHLHKQVVAIDEVGDNVEATARVVEANPRAVNEYGLDIAIANRLLVAANQHAVAFAGFGHRYPAVEICSLSARREPWLMAAEEIEAMSDLLHAVHAAGGPQLSCNEEWHHRPPAMDLAMPWRIIVKWRISTLAGFEGDTRIYLNTQSPWTVRDRAVVALQRLRDEGHLAPGIAIGDEVAVGPGAIPV